MEQSFYSLCRNADAYAENFLQKEFDGLGLTPVQADLLLLIVREYPHGTTLTELHRRTGATKSSLCTLLKSVKQKGYLRSEEFGGDERVKMLFPTEKLLASAQRFASAENRLEAALQTAVGESGWKQMKEALSKVCRSMQNVPPN